MSPKRTDYHRKWNAEHKERRNADRRARYKAREDLGLCPLCGKIPWEGKLCQDCKHRLRPHVQRDPK